MFEVSRPKQKPIVVIRAATGKELSEYEKHKLASIEKNAQENKIEIISLNVDGHKQQIMPINKEVRIDLGKMALSDSVTPADISTEDLFIIRCTLDDAELK